MELIEVCILFKRFLTPGGEGGGWIIGVGSYVIHPLLLGSPCARFGQTLVREFHISNSHAKLYLIFSRGEIVLALAEASPIKTKSN